MFRLSFDFSINFSFRKKNTDKRVSCQKKFTDAAKAVIQRQSSLRAQSTIDNYQTALRSFVSYAGAEITMSNINSQLIEGYQQWLTSQQVCLNTVSCYMRSLRSLMHLACPDQDALALFKQVFTGKKRTEKRSITISDINRLTQLRLTGKTSLAFSRDIFLFSVYALGMPFVDIAYLRKSQIVDGYICYQRHKTKQPIRVLLEQPMQQIINRYWCSDGPYVFPILSSEDASDCNHQYAMALARYNRHLRKLGPLIGLQHPLTSYVARHSWASIAYQSDVELAVISKAMGHTSPNTTLTYLREIDDQRIDAANSRLLEKLAPDAHE